jgi:Holliday junction resolvase-like predicted endonuclease
MPKHRNLKFEKIARLYLDMRGFKILEQNWSQGKNKIDVIAEKSHELHFINLKSLDLDQHLDISENKAIENAVEAYVLENKYSGKINTSTLIIDPKTFIVVSFIS